MVEQGRDNPYSVLPTIGIVGDEQVTSRVRRLQSAGDNELANREIIGSVVGAVSVGKKMTMLLTDTFPNQAHFQTRHPTGGRVRWRLNHAGSEQTRGGTRSFT